MSLENAKKLVSALKDSEELKKKFQDAGEEGFESLAANEGYACTTEEMKDAIKEMASELELSDEDLDKIAGGKGGGSVVLVTARAI